MNDENRQRAHQTLADEAERLQTQINEFIGRATMARVELPGPLYDANAELLLPARLREAAMHRAQFAEARRNAATGRRGGRWRLRLSSR